MAAETMLDECVDTFDKEIVYSTLFVDVRDLASLGDKIVGILLQIILASCKYRSIAAPC